jgi:hypothetical protein
MWGLQFFVNQKLKIRPEIGSLEDYIALPSQEKIDVRDRLWAEAGIIAERGRTELKSRQENCHFISIDNGILPL